MKYRSPRAAETRLGYTSPNRRQQGLVVVKAASPDAAGNLAPAEVKTFPGTTAFERWLLKHPGTVVQAAKQVLRGDVQDITSHYQHLVDLHHYMAASKDILEVISAH